MRCALPACSIPRNSISARAQQQAAAASLEQAQRQYQRQHEVDRRATTQETIDASTSQQLSADANLKSAKAQVAVAELVPEQIRQASSAVEERLAQVAQAQAQLVQADLNLSYTEVRAPSDGFVTQRSVQLGDYVTAGSNMFLIVTPQVWITANFKESQLGRMRPGDAVDIKIDAYSGYCAVRPRAEHPVRKRLALLRVPGRKCHGQLREDRAASARQDRDRSGARSQSSAASGVVRESGGAPS